MRLERTTPPGWGALTTETILDDGIDGVQLDRLHVRVTKPARADRRGAAFL